jgi:hypothetical protein
MPDINQQLSEPMLTLLVDQVALNPNVTIDTGHALATNPDFSLSTFDMNASRSANRGPLACDIVGWCMASAD